MPQPTLCGIAYKWTVLYNNTVVYESENVVPTKAQVPKLYYLFENEGEYEVVLEVCDCCGCCSYIEKLSIGPKLYVNRTNCLKQILVDNNIYKEVILSIKLIDLENNELNLFTNNAYNGKQTFEITLPEDGIYILEYTVTEQNGTLISNEQFVLFDFCTLLRCYAKVLSDLNCKECKPCSEKDELNTQYLMQINQFMANLNVFIMNTGLYYGLVDSRLLYEEQYVNVLKNMQTVVQKLKEFCSACRYLETNKYPTMPSPLIKPCGCQ